MRPNFEVRRYRGVVTTHTHDYHQAVLSLRGQLDMVIGDVEGQVSNDNLALIGANVSHSFRGSRGNAFLVIDIPTAGWAVDDESSKKLWEQIKARPFVGGTAELRPFVRYLAAAAERGQLRGENVSHACSLLLGIIAAQLGIDEQMALPASLRAICGYVDTHLEWPLAVPDLAKVANVSASRLHILFRNYLSITPGGYVTQRRLHKALQLLERTNLSVADVAQRVGYSDQAAFSRAFRRHTGETPVRHRAAVQRHQHKIL